MTLKTVPYINPYIAGNPVHGNFGFFGRADILRQVEQILAAPGQNAVILFGPRRIGKTSVLLQLQDSLPSEKYTVIYQDLQDKAHQPMGKLLAELAGEISEALDLGKSDLDLASDNRGQIFRYLFLPRVYKALPDKKQRLVLLFDEFDVLDATQRERLPDNAAANQLFATLRRWMRVESRLAFIFALGRNLNDLDSDFHSTFKGGQTVRISVLSREEAIDLITNSDSLHFTNEAIERIYAVTNGHPYFIQLLCSLCFDRAYERLPEILLRPPVISAEDVEALLPVLFSRGDNIFAWIWDGLPPVEKLTASALAKLLPSEKATATNKDIENILKSYSKRLVTRDLEVSPDKLVEWQLLQKQSGGYCFLVPLLHQWIRQKKPLAKVHDEFDRLHPRADHYFQIAKLDYQENKLNDAAENLKRALNLYPDHLQALLLMGDIQSEKSQFYEAIRFYKKAYELAPEQSRRRLIVALLKHAENLSAGKDSELLNALKVYYTIKEIDPETHVQKPIDNLLVRIESWLNILATTGQFLKLKDVSESLADITNDETWLIEAKKLEYDVKVKTAYETAKKQINSGQFTKAIQTLRNLRPVNVRQSINLLLDANSIELLLEAERLHLSNQKQRWIGRSVIILFAVLSSYIFGTIIFTLIFPVSLLEMAISVSLFGLVVALLYIKKGERKEEDERYSITDFFRSFGLVVLYLIGYFIFPGSLAIFFGWLIWYFLETFLVLYFGIGLSILIVLAYRFGRRNAVGD